MPLFEVPKRAGKINDKTIAKRANTRTRQQNTVKVVGGLLGRINEIKAMVEKHLGQYKDEYIIIDNEKVLHEYIGTAIKKDIISMDTETLGLDPMTDDIVGFSMYAPGKKPAYVPINHISYVTGVRVENQLSKESITKELKRLTATKIVMFNAAFDIRVFRNQLGIDLDCWWDAYLAARLLNDNEPSNGLKQLHKKYVLDDKEDAFNFEQYFRGVPFDRVPISCGYLYAANDAKITYELYKFQEPFLSPENKECKKRKLEEVAWVFHNIEMPCIRVVCDMEDTGVLFDLKYQQKLSEKYNKILEERTDYFYTLCEDYSKDIQHYRIRYPDNKLDNPINISSPTQIAILLYDILQVKSPDSKNPRGTGEGILNKIDHPIAKAVLEYRETKKLLSTYIEKLPECVNPKDGRIHCRFNQYGADTGRFSSSDPNLQNIPSHNKDIRKMFVASDGYVLMSSDYSQQEPKVMTQMCQDPKMIDAYKHGKDLYAEIAALSFNTTYENCLEFRPDGTTNPDGKNRRTQAKSILLGVLYGRGVPSIAEQLGTTTKKAQTIKDSVFKGFPAIPQFEEDSLAMAEELGYVTTLWGRKRRLPNLQLEEYEFRWKDGAPPDDDLLDFTSEMSENMDGNKDVPEEVQEYYLRKLHRAYFGEKRKIFEEANKEGIWIVDNGAKIAEAERQCVNARIQGSAADMTKLAMILINNDKKLKKLGFRLLIPVHDELIAECPKENAKEAAKRFADLMAQAAESKLEIPISCDVEITKAWYGQAVKL